MIVIAESRLIATVLLLLGATLWVILIYTILTAWTIKREKPTLAEGINGGWLLAVVATQSIAVLIALLSDQWDQPLRLHANFVALSMWLWGGMVYIWIVSLIFYRTRSSASLRPTWRPRTGSTCSGANPPGQQRRQALLTGVGHGASARRSVELRGERVAAGSAGDRGERPEDHGLDGDGRLDEADRDAELARDRCQPQRVGHAPRVDATERAERPQRLDHRHEAGGGPPGRRVCRRYLDANLGGAIAGVPPVVHGAGRHLDDPFARADGALAPGDLKADLARVDPEPLDEVVVDVRIARRGEGSRPRRGLPWTPLVTQLRRTRA
jgi:hypothetical protein